MSAHPMARLDRPGALVAVVVLKVINGLFGLLTASLLLLSHISQGEIRVAALVGTIPVAVPIAIMALSLLELLGAVGLWMLRRWARLLAITVAPPFGLLAAFGIVASGGRDPGTYLTVVVALLTLSVLLQPRIKHLFN